MITFSFNGKEIKTSEQAVQLVKDIIDNKKDADASKLYSVIAEKDNGMQYLEAILSKLGYSNDTTVRAMFFDPQLYQRLLNPPTEDIDEESFNKLPSDIQTVDKLIEEETGQNKHTQGESEFTFYRAGILHFKTDTGILFEVPVKELGDDVVIGSKMDSKDLSGWIKRALGKKKDDLND